MKIYVAAKFEDPRAQQVMDRLKDAGHTITMEWTKTEKVDGLTGRILAATLRRYAEMEVQAVHDADCLVLLASPTGKGSYTELGVAIGLSWIGLNKKIIVENNQNIVNIFFHLPQIYHAENEDHIVALLESFKQE